jgi:hypothetical protein
MGLVWRRNGRGKKRSSCAMAKGEGESKSACTRDTPMASMDDDAARQPGDAINGRAKTGNGGGKGK